MKIISGDASIIQIGKPQGENEIITLNSKEERVFDGYCVFILIKGSVVLSSIIPEISFHIKSDGYIFTPRFKVKAGKSGCTFELKTTEQKIKFLK